MPARPPPLRTRTDREALREALASGRELTVRDLSQEAGLSEDEVRRHLEHLARSVKAEGARLVIRPPECLACGFVFEGRQRTSRPGKCPECRSTRIGPPTVQLVVAA